MKRNVIITASDEKYGNFLINHWLKSLKENTDLENIDVFVIDYGLSNAQKDSLKSQDVKLYKGIRDGHIVVIRFRDIKNILLKIFPTWQKNYYLDLKMLSLFMVLENILEFKFHQIFTLN